MQLTEAVHDRYPVLDPAHATFLRHVKSCVDRDRLTWLLCENDYNGTSAWPIRWNEWELHAAEVTIGMRDHARRVEAFWRCHVPIAGTLRREYSYIVIRVQGPDAGVVFYGQDPEGERLERVGSFSQLLDVIAAKVSGGEAPTWASRFL